MQKTWLLLLIVFAFNALHAQKNEISLSFNSGLFSFSGPSAEKSSFIYYEEPIHTGYTINPYGAKNAICYGASGTFKRVSKGKIIFGLDAGYEIQRSRIAITSVSVYTPTLPYNYAANGNTFLQYNAINLFPYIGYRFTAGRIFLDLAAGIERSFFTKTTEKGKATANGTIYSSTRDRKTISGDTRPRVQLSASYQRTGIYVGYSYGLANYKEGYIGGVNDCHARLIRFGISYRLY